MMRATDSRGADPVGLQVIRKQGPQAGSPGGENNSLNAEEVSTHRNRHTHTTHTQKGVLTNIISCGEKRLICLPCMVGEFK